MNISCDYCRRPAQLVGGDVIYPHRPDLAALRFWHCAPCDAFVGCHKAGNGYGDGTRPLGRLANAELRRAKSAAHEAFDPLWKSGRMSRRDAYARLAQKLGIHVRDCHIGMFDLAACQRVMAIAPELSSFAVSSDETAAPTPKTVGVR